MSVTWLKPHKSAENGLIEWISPLQAKYEFIEIIGLPPRGDRPAYLLEELMVPPTLSEDELSPYSSSDDIEKSSLSCIDQLEKTPQTVIVGDTGAGKSTLLQWLVTQWKPWINTQVVSKLGQRVPFPVILRHLNIPALMQQPDDLDDTPAWLRLLHAAAEAEISSISNSPNDLISDLVLVCPPDDVLWTLVKTGQAAFLVDGLDELRDDEQRGWVLETIQDAIDLNREAVNRDEGEPMVAVVTTRPLDLLTCCQKLDNEPPSPRDQQRPDACPWEGPVVYLAPFTDEDVHSYSRWWYDSWGAIGEWPFTMFDGVPDNPEVRAKAHAIVQRLRHNAMMVQADAFFEAVQGHPRLRGMARVPGLLVLMLRVHKGIMKLPEGRRELYDTIVETHLEASGRPDEVPDVLDMSPNRKRTWLVEIAYRVQCARIRLNKYVDHCGDDYEFVTFRNVEARIWLERVRREVEPEIDAYWDHVCRRSGLVRPVRREGALVTYRFTHVGIQEYLAACWWRDDMLNWSMWNDEQRKERWDELMGWVEAPVAHEALVLLFQELGEETASKLFERIQKSIPERVKSREAYKLNAKLLAEREACNIPLSSLEQVKGLTALETPTAKRVMEVVGSCVALDDLCLTGAKIADISALGTCTQLKTLDLTRTQVADISVLTTCTRLHYLFLTRTRVADISALRTCTQLVWIDLNHTPVVDINPLHKCTRLKQVYLRHTRVVDISALGACRNLKWLDLSHTRVVDMSALSTCRKLVWLDLRHTQGVEIRTLSACTKLAWLDLRDTDMPEEYRKRFTDAGEIKRLLERLQDAKG